MGNYKKFFFSLIWFLFLTFLLSCAGGPIHKKEKDQIDIDKEFDSVIRVENVKTPKKEDQKERVLEKPLDREKSLIQEQDIQKKPETTSLKNKSFLKPFQKREKIILSAFYLKMDIGDIVFEVFPAKIVNGKKSYHFGMKVKTSEFFSKVYKVDDWAETFVDSQNLWPTSMKSFFKTKKSQKDVRNYFNWDENRAVHWEKKVVQGEQTNRKKEWDIQSGAQNVLSAFFYLRDQPLEVGKKFSFL